MSAGLFGLRGQAASGALARADAERTAEMERVAADSAPRLAWWLCLAASFGMLLVLSGAVLYLLLKGVGIWGNNVPVVWALDIVSYDWWMGVACGSLLVSALILHRSGRGALTRIADTTALVGAAAAAIYPIIHLGRPWFFYWNLVYPNVFGLWPQFRSPLVWDESDIIGFLVIALLFWFTGLIPDCALLRDRAPTLLQQRFYGVVALGWRGEASHWTRWRRTHRLLALVGALIAVNVQWGASMMYAVTLEPGWHDPMEPVTDLAIAVLAGAGAIAVLNGLVELLYPGRKLVGVVERGLLGGTLLGAALATAYCYAAQLFFAGLNGDSFARAAALRELSGGTAWSFWLLMVGALLPAQLLWLPAARGSAPVLFLLGLLALGGAWCAHFLAIVGGLQHDFLPSSYQPFGVTIWSVATWAGTGGLFLFLFLLCLRYLPIVPMTVSRFGGLAGREAANG